MRAFCRTPASVSYLGDGEFLAERMSWANLVSDEGFKHFPAHHAAGQFGLGDRANFLAQSLRHLRAMRLAPR